MSKRPLLWAIVVGSTLGIAGCGDDSSSNGGSSSSTCEAICSSNCALQGVDPELGRDECISNCQSSLPQFDDNCGTQADAYLACIEGQSCDPEATQCQSQAIAWGTCIAGSFQ
ncbi:MAG: hypothetical protein PVH21_09955 [Myxococcales bacterium]